jgi:hypothetical protein
VRGGRNLRYDYRPRLPEAYVVGATTRVTPGAAQRRIAGEEAFDPLSTALIEQRCPACPPAGRPGLAGTVHNTRWDPGSVTVDLDASRAGVLVVSQAFFKGWRATVDGRAAPVMRVNGLVQGVPVGAGRHRVTLRYRAPGLGAGAVVSAATLFVLLAWWAVDRRRRRAAVAT